MPSADMAMSLSSSLVDIPVNDIVPYILVVNYMILILTVSYYYIKYSVPGIWFVHSEYLMCKFIQPLTILIK